MCIHLLLQSMLTGITTLKKHYNNLWMSLPEDHMITLRRLSDIYKMHNVKSDNIFANCDLSNQEILNKLISDTKNDIQLLGLSFLIERLAFGDVLISDCPHIESFRNG